MTTRPPRGRPPLDLVELAEDVVYGRRTLANVIDQIAVATPDDAARRRAVAELQTLVQGLTGVRRHAAATADVARRERDTPRGPAAALIVAPRRVRQGGGVFGGAGGVAAGLAILVGVVVVAIVAAQVRPGPAVAVPSASLVSGAVGSPAPSTSPFASQLTISPTPRSAVDSLVRAVFWTRTENSLTVWSWTPFGGRTIRPLFKIATWDIPFAPSYDVTVLAAPDGQRFAIAEHAFGDPASHDRTRVVDGTGNVLWTSPDGQPRTIDMAWSNDGTMLALGALPSPWTVLWFEVDGSVRTQAFQLPSSGAYRLLGFDIDGYGIAGYETSGQAPFWQKPVFLDLLSEQLAAQPFPGWIARNSTGPIGAVNEATGAALAEVGTQRGPPQWVIHDASGDTPLGVDPTAQVTWATPDTLVVLAQDPAGTSAAVRTRAAAATGDGSLVATLATSREAARLLAASPNAAIVGTRSSAAAPAGDAWSTVYAVNLLTGEAADAVAPATDGGYRFAGWITRSPRVPVPSATAEGSPSPTAPRPTVQPAPTSLPVPTPQRTMSTVNLDHPRVPGAPDVALWSTGVAPGKITIWRWSPAKVQAVRPWLEVDTWPSGEFTTQVVASPDGTRLAVVESAGNDSPINRIRVFDGAGRVLWQPKGPTPRIAGVAWSPDSRRVDVPVRLEVVVHARRIRTPPPAHVENVGRRNPGCRSGNTCTSCRCSRP